MTKEDKLFKQNMDGKTFKEILLYCDKHEIEFDAIIGDVDMDATYCFSGNLVITEYCEKEFGELLNSKCNITVYDEGCYTPCVEVLYDDDEVGNNFTMALAGFISDTTYRKLFGGEDLDDLEDVDELEETEEPKDNIEKVIVQDKEQLDLLYNESAFTMEGCREDSIDELLEWIEQYTKIKQRRVFITKGYVMNLAYGLTGSNKYNNDLTIVSVLLSDLENPMNIVIPRFEIHGRWFDDIVDNNARREK